MGSGRDGLAVFLGGIVTAPKKTPKEKLIKKMRHYAYANEVIAQKKKDKEELKEEILKMIEEMDIKLELGRNKFQFGRYRVSIHIKEHREEPYIHHFNVYRLVR